MVGLPGSAPVLYRDSRAMVNLGMNAGLASATTTSRVWRRFASGGLASSRMGLKIAFGVSWVEGGRGTTSRFSRKKSPLLFG